jgi:prepilin-type N-terminal cleavage/methylation domain-containing protein
MRQRQNNLKHSSGFTVIELMIVLIVSLILVGFAIPNIVGSMHTSKMRGAVSDFASLIESQRLYAIRDNRFYSIYILAASGAAPAQAYVDMFPKSSTGASGNGGTAVVSGNPGTTGDPVMEISSEITQQAQGNAPSTTNLQNQLLPANTTVAPVDASVTPITFGPRGLPCAPLSVTGGTVCNTSGGPVAYWIFFKNSSSTEWHALTVTPAGRIQKWYYTGSQWNTF